VIRPRAAFFLWPALAARTGRRWRLGPALAAACFACLSGGGPAALGTARTALPALAPVAQQPAAQQPAAQQPAAQQPAAQQPAALQPEPPKPAGPVPAAGAAVGRAATPPASGALRQSAPGTKAPPQALRAAGSPAAAAPAADGALLAAERDLLRRELEGRPRPPAEQSAARAAEQILSLIESGAPALAAFQARAYLGHVEALLPKPDPAADAAAPPAPPPGPSPTAPAAGAVAPAPSTAAKPSEAVPSGPAAPAGQAATPAAPQPGSSGAGVAPAGAAPSGESPEAPGLPERPPALELAGAERALLELLRAAALWERLEARWEQSGSGGGPGDALAAALESEAAAALEAASLAAGTGALRLTALYNLGTLRLLSAEQAFLTLAGERLLAGDAGPDTAALRERYGAIAEALRDARAPLLTRLALDWQDRATRANLEWLQRRLEEVQRALDELPPEPPPEQQPAPSDQPPPESEPPPEDQPEQQGEQGQPEPRDGESGESDREPAEPPPAEQAPEQPQPGSESEPAAEGEPQPEPSEPAGETDPQDSESAAGVAPEALTETEIQRLLDRLEQYERLREELRARRRAQRRAVERDW
jgi:hypothetical protein